MSDIGNLKFRGVQSGYDIKNDSDYIKILLKDDEHQKYMFQTLIPSGSDVGVLIEKLERLIVDLKKVNGAKYANK